MEESNKNLCPYCNAELDAEAQKCKFCGEWVNKNSNELPSGLKHFNWGAFLLNWIWGIMHGKYITLVYFPACIIPVIGPLAVSIWFGIMGNKWAWESKTWVSVEEFNTIQRNWVKLWVILSILGVVICLKVALLLFIISNINV
ncbi:MAG: hypothetical protein NC191_07255 [Muribaculaceae bacterium]|nr:hypothetical protein [Muribaculaceae bacterium]